MWPCHRGHLNMKALLSGRFKTVALAVIKSDQTITKCKLRLGKKAWTGWLKTNRLKCYC